jgi:Uma2 family endonuclease
MALAIEKPRFTEDEYFAALAASTERLEFWDGDIVAMAGAQPRHVDAEGNILGHMREHLKGSPCRIFTSNQAIRLPGGRRYFFPDGGVRCGEASYMTLQGIACLENPTVLIEVASESTRRNDLGAKWMAYQQLESLREYIVIDPDAIFVLVYSRTEPTPRWTINSFEQLTDTITLQSIGIQVPLSEIYDGLNLAPTANTTSQS